MEGYQECDVAVVGGGPAGLGAATRLRTLDAGHVMVLEREAAAGGIPRHCGHPPFGLREFGRILTGPTYVARLCETAENAGVDVRCLHTVVETGQDGLLRVSTPEGMTSIRAGRVLLATGVRETPRSARLISGTRPPGVMTTGALQSMVYGKGRRPFSRPVIIGTELVSFSALLTCRHASIRPAAMVEAQERPTAWRSSVLLPRMMGVRVLFDTELSRIEGRERVTHVQVITPTGALERIDCDGVIFSGRFIPESTLVRSGHLETDPVVGSPVIDQFHRCSDPAYFATGNLLHPADSAGRCWLEGVETADQVIRSLAGTLPEPDISYSIQPVTRDIRYAIPQKLTLPSRSPGGFRLRVRFSASARGRLHLHGGDEVIVSKSVHALPEKQITLPVPSHRLPTDSHLLELSLEVT